MPLNVSPILRILVDSAAFWHVREQYTGMCDPGITLRVHMKENKGKNKEEMGLSAVKLMFKIIFLLISAHNPPQRGKLL